MNEFMRAGLGLAVVAACFWAMAEQRRLSNLRPLLIGVFWAVGLAFLLTRVPSIAGLMEGLAQGANSLQRAASTGTQFVFGYLGGGPQPFAAAGAIPFIFAFQALPSFLLVSALSALAWHWGILRRIVHALARLFGLLFGVSGPVGVATSACIFLGMVEAPLLIRPLIARLSRGEIFILMVDGLAVLASSNLVFLAALLGPRLPGAFAWLMTAILVSTPLAIGAARMLVPTPRTNQDLMSLGTHYKSGLDAIIQGTLTGAKMAFNIAALLIVFIGIMALIDQVLAALPHQGGPLTLTVVLKIPFIPVAWLMGVPAPDIAAIASLLGTKLSFNEVVAYVELAKMLPLLSAKAQIMAAVSLCSFGNIASVAILIGALNTMAPERAGDIVPLGFRALATAFLVNCVAGTIIGVVWAL